MFSFNKLIKEYIVQNLYFFFKCPPIGTSKVDKIFQCVFSVLFIHKSIETNKKLFFLIGVKIMLSLKVLHQSLECPNVPAPSYVLLNIFHISIYIFIHPGDDSSVNWCSASSNISWGGSQFYGEYTRWENTP